MLAASIFFLALHLIALTFLFLNRFANIQMLFDIASGRILPFSNSAKSSSFTYLIIAVSAVGGFPLLVVISRLGITIPL